MWVCVDVWVCIPKQKKEADLGPLQHRKMEIFVKEINGEKPLVIDTKRMVLDLPLAV